MDRVHFACHVALWAGCFGGPGPCPVEIRRRSGAATYQEPEVPTSGRTRHPPRQYSTAARQHRQASYGPSCHALRRKTVLLAYCRLAVTPDFAEHPRATDAHLFGRFLLQFAMAGFSQVSEKFTPPSRVLLNTEFQSPIPWGGLSPGGDAPCSSTDPVP